MNIAMLPLEIEWGDKKTNLDRVSDAVSRLHPQTDILVLPETFSTGFPVPGTDKEEVRELAERNSGPTMEFIKQLANANNMAICGSFIADSGGSIYNRAFFIEPSGEETFADKHHLFSMAGEPDIFSRGFKRLSVRFRGWNISMIVCYDIRFPVWCRNELNSYDLLIAVANWPDVRVDAWRKLLPARAIENLAYVCGVDCKGTDPKGFNYDGSSLAFDFKGKDITTNVDNPDGVLYASLSAEKLLSFRNKFPAWKDADNFKLI